MTSSFYQIAIREITLNVPENKSELDLSTPEAREAYDILKAEIAAGIADKKEIDQVVEFPS